MPPKRTQEQILETCAKIQHPKSRGNLQRHHGHSAGLLSDAGLLGGDHILQSQTGVIAARQRVRGYAGCLQVERKASWLAVLDRTKACWSWEAGLVTIGGEFGVPAGLGRRRWGEHLSRRAKSLALLAWACWLGGEKNGQKAGPLTMITPPFRHWASPTCGQETKARGPG